MEQLSFIERLKNLFNIIIDSPLFILIALISLATLVLLIVNVKSESKIIKIITAILYFILVFVIFSIYIKPILSAGDSLVDKIFTIIYFPNFISYICMMIITILLFIMIIFNKKFSKFGKYTSILFFCVIEFLFVLVLDTILSNDINIYEKTSLYSNESLVILIQSSTITFALWLVFLMISAIVNRTGKKKEPKVIPIVKDKDGKDKNIFNRLREEKPIDILENIDEPENIDDESFNKMINNYKHEDNYKKFIGK